MGFGKIFSYIINPLAFVADKINESRGVTPEQLGTEPIQLSEIANEVGDKLSNLWDDATGKTQIEMQNEFNRQMAEEEYQRNLQSISDTASAYDAAGFNRNIMYGGSNGSPVQYSAPNLQAFSGSAKIDNILSRVGKVLSFIPAMYNATAALEKIDQERQKTAQSQMRTTAMGMDLIDKGYRISDIAHGRPYGLHVPQLFVKGTRSRIAPELFSNRMGFGYEMSSKDSPSVADYLDASARNKLELLNSIGLMNALRTTRNNYMGYQYDLDRRFGAMGRIVGMASQGLGSASKFVFPALKIFK